MPFHGRCFNMAHADLPISLQSLIIMSIAIVDQTFPQSKGIIYTYLERQSITNGGLAFKYALLRGAIEHLCISQDHAVKVFSLLNTGTLSSMVKPKMERTFIRQTKSLKSMTSGNLMMKSSLAWESNRQNRRRILHQGVISDYSGMIQLTE